MSGQVDTTYLKTCWILSHLFTLYFLNIYVAILYREQCFLCLLLPDLLFHLISMNMATLLMKRSFTACTIKSLLTVPKVFFFFTIYQLACPVTLLLHSRNLTPTCFLFPGNYFDEMPSLDLAKREKNNTMCQAVMHHQPVFFFQK